VLRTAAACDRGLEGAWCLDTAGEADPYESLVRFVWVPSSPADGAAAATPASVGWAAATWVAAAGPDAGAAAGRPSPRVMEAPVSDDCGGVACELGVTRTRAGVPM
jgi:hypothetical protein